MINYFVNNFLKQTIKFVISLYFRKWSIKGLENIPKGQPVIFAPNHQSAFLDALIVTCSTKRIPYYLARAEVFENPTARKILTFIRLLPIYRFRDGLKNVRKNDEIIKRCDELLRAGESLLIFPEGNHGAEWNLRPLQRGLSRIAFQTMVEGNWEVDLKVIPVGINYESPNLFRGRLFVQIGEPISMKDYQKSYVENDRDALDLLKDDLAIKLKPLLLHLNSKPSLFENYHELEKEFKKRRIYKKDMSEQLKADQLLADSLDSGNEVSLPPSDKKPFLNPLGFIFGPISFLINYLPFKFALWFNDRYVSDPVFKSSIKLGIGFILVPLYYFILAAIVGLIFGFKIGLMTFIGLPLVSYLGFNRLRIWMQKTN